MSNLLGLTTTEPVSTYTNPHGQIDALIAQHGADQIALEDMLYGSIRNPVPRVEAPGLGLLEYVDTGPLIGMKALAGLVGKGGKTAKKILDFTQVQAWKKPFKSGTTYKAYHGKPGGKPITDVYTGMHVGSPGAAIDRLAETSSLLSRVPAGYVTALELSPKNPLLKTSPHFKHIYKKWNRGPYKTPSYSSRPTGEIDKSTQLLDEYLGADYSFLQAFQKSNIDLMKMIRRLGYDTIPYINKWENPGSVSTIILNPKRASPNILDEAYRFEMPFYKSTEPTMNLSKKQLKEWISQQKAGKGDLYDIFMQNAPGQKLVRFNKYGIPIVTSPLGPVQANKDYINQILTIKDLMQATK